MRLRKRYTCVCSNTSLCVRVSRRPSFRITGQWKVIRSFGNTENACVRDCVLCKGFSQCPADEVCFFVEIEEDGLNRGLDLKLLKEVKHRKNKLMRKTRTREKQGGGGHRERERDRQTDRQRDRQRE